MLASIFFALLGAFAVGGVFLALGIRGRRLNDHPTCRDCGFDLENVYPANSTCPECGSGLKRPKAVRIGQRRRRPILIWLGLVLIIAPLLPFGLALFAAATGKDVQQYAPLGVLIWEAQRADTRTGKAISAELLNRMLAGTLDPAQEARIVEVSLARQANADFAWDEAWGELIERAKLDGRLSADQEQRFLKNVVVPKLKSRPIVAAGDPIPVRIETEIRTGGGMQSLATLWLKSAMLDGKPIRRSILGTETNPFWGMAANADMPVAEIYAMGSKGQNWFAGMNSNPSLTFLGPDALKPGKGELTLVLESRGTTWSPNSMQFAFQKPREKDGTTREWTLRVPIEIAPSERAGVERIGPTEEMTSKLAAALQPGNATVTKMGFPVGNMMQLTFPTANLPVPVAFDVMCRSGETTVRIGSFTSGTGETQEGFMSQFGGMDKDNKSVSGGAPGIKGSVVDIILKPRPDLALRTIDMTRVYDGEVVIKNVSIQRIDTSSYTSSVTMSTTTTVDKEVTSADDKASGEDAKPAKNPAKNPKDRSWMSKWLFYWD